MSKPRATYGRNGARNGESHHMARLTDAQVREIRAKYSPHIYTQKRLAAEYGCGRGTIRDIVLYITRANA